jgi:hypothetical protein
MKDFRQLQIWERYQKFTLGGYKVTERFPASVTGFFF